MLTTMPVVSAQAAMVDTDQIINPTQSSLTRNDLQQLLDQEAVQQKLRALGASPESVRLRVDSLTSSELARINQEINNLNAGGDSILGILLIIFIVFVITDVIGATDIFPFIHPVK
jgi:hypothetical protein